MLPKDAMMRPLTIVYITARKEPRIEWFIQSLERQADIEKVEIIVVDLYFPNSPHPSCGLPSTLRHVAPKPNVWQGEYRLTKENWWAISNARNTGVCLCKTEWIAFCDDRCVLAPTWMQSVRKAMMEGYAVSGSYEKRTGMAVDDGIIANPGTLIGVDHRNPKGHMTEPEQTFGDGYYGCTSACPLEWCLEMNGWDENCDSLGLEDVVFGNRLVANGRITKFDPRMKIIEDRSPEACQNMPLRTDKDRHLEPRDKSHILLERFGGGGRSQNRFDIRAVRDSVLAGNPFPIPTEPSTDWFDGEPLSEMYVR